MTVIALDIDKIIIENKTNLTKETILNNDPIETNLHVICVVSNPCLYKKRYELAIKFIRKMLKTDNVILYVVELVYGNEDFYITNSTNPLHLQLRTNTAPIWHKENMINIGVNKLLPPEWKAFAWIDADIEFDIQAYYTEEDGWQVEKITFTDKVSNQKLLKQQITNTFLEDINN
jgi:hypothetical protein